MRYNVPRMRTTAEDEFHTWQHSGCLPPEVTNSPLIIVTYMEYDNLFRSRFHGDEWRTWGLPIRAIFPPLFSVTEKTQFNPRSDFSSGGRCGGRLIMSDTKKHGGSFEWADIDTKVSVKREWSGVEVGHLGIRAAMELQLSTCLV